MKPRNFPMRKLMRKLVADGMAGRGNGGAFFPRSDEAISMLESARTIRTKKKRGGDDAHAR